MKKSRYKDIKYAKLAKERDGCCIHCGSTYSLEAHHIIPRSFIEVRYDLNNIITLCFNCHYKVHNIPEFKQMLYNKLGLDNE